MTGRLSTLQAAWVIARRDFTAILFSRSFFFFLLGPLFPLVVGLLAGGVGQQVEQVAERPELGIAMSAADVARMQAAAKSLRAVGGIPVPDLRVIDTPAAGARYDAVAALRRTGVQAMLTGSAAAPVLTGPESALKAWRGPVALLSDEARGMRAERYPTIALVPIASSKASDHRSRLLTAQAAQTLLFLLTMLLAGMVLSNLVEEKGNKIIEILAAAIPMDAVFLGKLFAMLAVSMVGIAVWGTAGGAFALSTGRSLADFAAPAVGWPLFLILGVTYFAMGYLLLGSVFLAIGSMATTVREVQTLSMPVTMMQLLVFFLAAFAMTSPGSPAEIAAVVIPFSSPFAMLARAAQVEAVWPHLVALGWQALCVLVFVRLGARMFRTRVMKSGPQRRRRGLFARRRPA